MNYYVNDVPRLRLFFDTPNELAVALVMLWGGFLYYYSITENRKPVQITSNPLSRVARSMGLIIISIVPVCCLVATYSRSGVVAFAVVACLLWRSRKARKWIAVSLVVCALCLLLMPESGGRFTRIEPFADKSISHRFDVWRGTLSMSLEKPWTGYGVQGFGEMLTAWYLPVKGSNAIYLTAVSSPLTILGFWGYPALFVYILGWLLLLIAGFRGLYYENKRVTACFIIQMAFLLGGFFAYLHKSWILNVILLVSIYGTIIFHLNENLNWRTHYRRWCTTAVAISGAACGLIAVVGFLFFSHGYSLHRFPLTARGESTGQAWVLIPDKPNGGRLVWIVASDRVREHARSLCRPLASQGWRVFMLGPGMGEILSPEVGAAFVNRDAVFSKSNDSMVLGGIGEDGLAALALAARLTQKGEGISKTVVLNIVSYWPFEEYNPQNTVKTASGPLILAYGGNDTRYFRAANTLVDIGRNVGRQVDLLPLEGTDDADLLVALRTEFFEKEPDRVAATFHQ